LLQLAGLLLQLARLLLQLALEFGDVLRLLQLLALPSADVLLRLWRQLLQLAFCCSSRSSSSIRSARSRAVFFNARFCTSSIETRSLNNGIKCSANHWGTRTWKFS
jgi:hypothetical protein